MVLPEGRIPIINECFTKLLVADGVILGSPVYAGWLTPSMKGFIEKAVFMARAPIKRGAPHTVLRNKVGVAVCSQRAEAAAYRPSRA